MNIRIHFHGTSAHLVPRTYEIAVMKIIYNLESIRSTKVYFWWNGSASGKHKT